MCRWWFGGGIFAEKGGLGKTIFIKQVPQKPIISVENVKKLLFNCQFNKQFGARASLHQTQNTLDPLVDKWTFSYFDPLRKNFWIDRGTWLAEKKIGGTITK